MGKKERERWSLVFAKGKKGGGDRVLGGRKGRNHMHFRSLEVLGTIQEPPVPKWGGKEREKSDDTSPLDSPASSGPDKE